MSLWLNRRRIVRAVAGELSTAEETALRAHLAGCPACRAHYDETSRAAEALGAATSARRERARLLAALAEPSAIPARPRAFRLVPVLAVAVAGAVAVALWLRPATPGEGVTWRGGGGDEDARAPVRLLLYASRKGDEGKPPGPLRLVAELPGAGEARVTKGDYLQFGYAGLTAAKYATVVAIDDAGGEHQYVPIPPSAPRRAEPTDKARGLGPSVFLGDQRPGRLRLFAIFADAPLESRAIRAAADRATARGRPGTLDGVEGLLVTGSLVIEP